MGTRTVLKSVTTVAGNWYRTRARLRSGDGTDTLHAVGGSVERSADAAYVSSLARAEDTSHDVGAETEDGNSTWDNITVQQWNGRHALPVGGAVPAYVEPGDTFQSKPGLAFASAAALIGLPSDAAAMAAALRVGWSAHFVLRRSVASFASYAPLFSIGESTAAGGRIQIEFTQDGLIRAQGRVGAGSFQGRTAPNGTLPNATEAILSVSAHSGQGWRIYLNGTRVDSVDVGTPTGLAPKDLPDFVAPNARVYLGALPNGAASVSSGGARVYRFIYADGSYYSDEHGFLKTIERLRAAYL